MSLNFLLFLVARLLTPEDAFRSSSAHLLFPFPLLLHTLASPNKAVAILTEVLSGLQLYFDRALGANLLYRFERSQYVEQRRRHQEAAGGSGAGEDFEASKIYGAEHLLRLFGDFVSPIADLCAVTGRLLSDATRRSSPSRSVLPLC